MKNFNITFSVDKDHINLMLVTLYSILLNNRDIFFNVYVLYGGKISKEWEDHDNSCMG